MRTDLLAERAIFKMYTEGLKEHIQHHDTYSPAVKLVYVLETME